VAAGAIAVTQAVMVMEEAIAGEAATPDNTTMSNPETTTEQELKFTPEALQALGIELQTQIGQLQPIQREQLLRFAAVARNQPGATRGVTPDIPATPASASFNFAPGQQQATGVVTPAQPGKPGEEIKPIPALSPGLFSPVNAAVNKQASNFSPNQFSQIFEQLRGGVQPLQSAARKSAIDVTKSIPSAIDPRFASILNPINVSTSETDTSGQTAVQAGTAAAAVAATVAAALIAS